MDGHLIRLDAHVHHLHVALHALPLLGAPGQLELRQLEDTPQQGSLLLAGLGDVLVGRIKRSGNVSGRSSLVLGHLRPGPDAPDGLLQAVRDGVRGGGHQAGGLGDLVTDLGVQPGSQSVVGVLVRLEPGARLVLGQVDGGGDLLLPGHVAVGLLAVVWAAVAADLDLYNIGILANNTGLSAKLSAECRGFFLSNSV